MTIKYTKHTNGNQNMNFRIDPILKQQFIAATASNGTTATRVLIEAVNAYMAKQRRDNAQKSDNKEQQTKELNFLD